MTAKLLEIESVNTFYGDSHVLFDVSMHFGEGEVVALLGRNGAGKTTTLRTIAGVMAPRSGQIRYGGTLIQGSEPYRIARHGLQLVPEERCVFKNISVAENLEVAALSAPNHKSLDEIYAIFPRLGERRHHLGRELSGGEQQMVAIARALIRDARIILLDEPFEGLAPLIVRDLIAVCRMMAREGRTLLVVEQNLAAAFALADRCYVLNNGHVVFGGETARLKADPALIRKHLGVGH